MKSPTRHFQIPVRVVLLCSIAQTMPAQLPPVPVPAGNPITAEKAVLGKILFWEEQLSSDNTVACATCHIPGTAGADPRMGDHPGPDGLFGTGDDLIGSPGVIHADAGKRYDPDPIFGLAPQVTGRSAPAVIGSQWAPELFWDGRAPDQFVEPQFGALSLTSNAALESQAVGPILSPVEMGHEGRTWDQVIAKLQVVEPLRLATDLPPDVATALAGEPSYPDLFATAFGGDPTITAERIGWVIATYERTLVPDQTPYDLGTLTPDQQQGLNMLQNNTVCLNCHVEPLFTDNAFYNIGLRPAAEDEGRMAVTGLADDFGRFKTPTLRNVGLKTSLMHVGWVTDVQDAIDYYNAPSLDDADPGWTGHVQFTDDQSGIPTQGPFLADYNSINMPVVTMGGVPMQARIIDFLVNGLTDPRVAGELPPFDRPTLHAEVMPANPEPLGAGTAGSGGFVPQMIAITPMALDMPDFKVGVGGGLGGAEAYLTLSLMPMRAGGAVDVLASSMSASAGPSSTGAPALSPTVTVPPFTPFGGPGSFTFRRGLASIFLLAKKTLSGSGDGQGYATFQMPIGNDPTLVGLEVHGRWRVIDPSGPGGVASSASVAWTVL